MAVELFAAAVTRPDTVFCDTSFILDLLTHEVTTVAADMRDLDADKQAKAAAAATFFHSYHTAGTQFCSSPYTLQEAGHVIAKNVLRNRSPYNRWDELERRDATLFATLHVEAMSIIQDAWNRVEHYGISFVVPDAGDDTPYGNRVNNQVAEAALLFMKAYRGLDAADAFHIAMGIACGLTWFATTDGDWKAVRQINVFCDK